MEEAQRAAAEMLDGHALHEHIAKGARSFSVNRGIESTERYVLQIVWDTLEDHTVGFRQSPAFAQWREVIGPFFQSPPNVEHFDDVTAP